MSFCRTAVSWPIKSGSLYCSILCLNELFLLRKKGNKSTIAVPLKYDITCIYPLPPLFLRDNRCHNASNNGTGS